MVIFIVIVALVLSGVYFWQKNSEPLLYSIKGVSVSVSKNKASFRYTVDQLKTMAEQCGTQQEAGYFDKLVAEFNGGNRIVYNFKYQGDSQDNSVFAVILLPNKAGYTSLGQFKKDFDQCFAAGDAYPKMLNNNWLLFTNSCGTGFDDGSGRVHGCEEVRKIVEPSLKLK